MAEAAAAQVKLTVFISYSREDLDFADQLAAILKIGGFETLVDRQDIRAGDEWLRQLGDMIRNADTVVLVLSPSSVVSEACLWEIQESTRFAKRILPVVPRKLDEHANVPPAISKLDYIFFYTEPTEPGSCFGRGLTELVEALNTDPEWQRAHTWLSRRAFEWVQAGRPTNRLLAGPDVQMVRTLSVNRPQNAPGLTALQVEFFKASEIEDEARTNERRRELDEKERLITEKEEQTRKTARTRQIAFSALSLVALALFAESWRAEYQKAAANVERAKAQQSQSEFLAEKANAELKGGDAGTALLLALEALPDPSLGVKRPEIKEARNIAARAHRELLELDVLAGHTRAITSATLSLDGTRLLTTSNDGEARIWTIASASHVRLQGHAMEVVQGRFTPDGSKAVTISKDATARVWDVANGRELHVLKGHEGQVNSLDLAEDALGRLLILTGSADRTARIWLAETGALLATLAGHSKGVTSARFSLGGRLAVTGSRDGTAIVWSIADLAAVSPALRLEGHTEDINMVAFDAAASKVVTASDDRTARIWSVETGRPLFDKKLGHEGAVMGAVFSGDGSLALTWSRDGQIRAWNAANGDLVRTFRGHDDEIRDLKLCDGGRGFATASLDRTARIWDIAQESPRRILRGHELDLTSVGVDRNCRQAATGSSDATARLWRLDTTGELKTFEGHTEPVHGVAWSHDGRLLASAGGILQKGGSDYAVRLWDTATSGRLAGPLVLRHEATVNSVAFSADGARLVTAADDTFAHVYEAHGGTPLRKLGGHTKSVRHASFDRTGKRVVTASRDGGARVFDAETGAVLADKFAERGWANSAVFSPDGTLVAIGYRDNAVGLWHLGTGQLEMLAGHSSSVMTVAFSHDGGRIASAAADGTVRQWRVKDRDAPALPTLRGHRGTVWSVVFRPDDRHLLTAGQDGTVRIWDGASGEELELFQKSPVPGASEPVRSAVYSPDGRRFAAAGVDTVVRVYDTPEAPPLDLTLAKSALRRCLTPQQREAYFLSSALPPRWCITGVGLERQPAAKWRPLWPYHTLDWRERLQDGG